MHQCPGMISVIQIDGKSTEKDGILITVTTSEE